MPGVLHRKKGGSTDLLLRSDKEVLSLLKLPVTYLYVNHLPVQVSIIQPAYNTQ